ncbi:MAG: protein kinase [Acidobacteriota bacterium]|nr:protein kinase [Acidobacteriota bacterium]
MLRPLLMIVDGESLRTPGLVSAMESDGWHVQWVRGSEPAQAVLQGPAPDLLLLDSAGPGQGTSNLAQQLRNLHPALPVLVLTEGGAAQGTGRQGGDVQGFLARTQPDQELVASLRRFRPEAPKLTTEDLFGDLLQELEAPPSAPVFAAFDPPPARPALPPPEGLTAEDIFGDVLLDMEALVPEVSRQPQPLLEREAGAPPPARPAPPEVQSPAEFTLSGISGVHDPFERPGLETPAIAVPVPAQSPVRPAPGVPGEARVLEEYGNYYLLEKIAVGGMAELFKAQQRGVQGFQKIVAIKRILPHFSDNEDFVTMFIDEAKLAAQLTHPNIAQIFDLGKAGSSYYIAMEYVNGRDLRTLLKRVREYGMPFPEQVAAFVVMKVAAALDYAHRKRGFDDRELKLVHRDISPQNILLSTEGAVKLVDFGIAKAASKASHTVAGALKGKLLYMSPEQATGQPLDNRSDLYSLGLVLFELVTGERCFQADSELGVLEKVRLGRVADLQALKPSISKEMAAIVNRALQKNVEHRYPSARFLERDLREFLQRQGTPITEHDVAEYVDALLTGPPDRLEALVAARFPQVASLSSGAHRVPSAGTGETATRVRDKTQPGLPPLPAMGLPGDSRPRPRWLLPAILVLAVLLGGLIWILSHS